MLLSFDRLRLRYDPYPIGVARDVIAPGPYAALVATFPPLALFRAMPGGGKYSLSEVNHPTQYRTFLETAPGWMDVYRYVKHPLFIPELFAVLRTHHVATPMGDRFSARFEFSAMPLAGGSLAPHTDLTSKVVTLVVSMIAADPDAETAIGAGTAVLRPRDPYQRLVDYHAPLEAFDRLDLLPYLTNQAVVFVKTVNSWHSVGPMTGGPGMRQTITINIERTR